VQDIDPYGRYKGIFVCGSCESWPTPSFLFHLRPLGSCRSFYPASAGKQAAPAERWPISPLEIVPADGVSCSGHNDSDERGERREERGEGRVERGRSRIGNLRSCGPTRNRSRVGKLRIRHTPCAGCVAIHLETTAHGVCRILLYPSQGRERLRSRESGNIGSR
jgi:hypothetical protein